MNRSMYSPAWLALAMLISPMCLADEPTTSKSTDIDKAPVFSATTAEPVLMRYKLKMDQVMKMGVDMDVDVHVQAGPQDIKMVQAMHFDAKARVTEVDDKGNMACVVKITHMTMKMSGMTDIAYDSDKPDEAPASFQGVAAMIDVGIPCKISPVGELLETDLEPLRLAAQRANNAALAKAVEDSVNQMFEGTFLQLSKDPIAAGATYKGGTILSDKTKMHLSYKIGSVSADKSKAVMEPSIEMEIPPDAFPGATGKITSQESNGWQVWDVEKGCPGDAQMHMHVGMELTSNGEKATVEITTTSRMTSKVE